MLRSRGAVIDGLLALGETRPTSADLDGRTRRRRNRRVWLIWACVFAIVVVGLSVVVSNHERHVLQFDEFDEQAHYDYAVALSQGHVPPSGTYLSQETLRMWSCFSGHGCQIEKRDPLAFAADGYSYEALEQPPLGYLPYLLTVRPGAPPDAALVDARWGGLIWEAVAAALLVVVGWLAELSIFEIGMVLVVALLGPVQMHAVATVTDDSAAVVAGSAVLATYLFARRSGRPVVVAGLVVGLVIGFMKGLFVVAPFVLLAGLIFGDLASHRRITRSDIWSRYGCSLAMFVGAVISYAVWTVIADLRAIVPPDTVLKALEGFSVSPYPRPSTIFIGIQNQVSVLSPYAQAPLYALWNIAVFGSLAGILVLKGPVSRTRIRATVLAVFVGMVALSVVFVLLNWSQGHFDFYAPSRYGLPLLPIVGLLLAKSLRIRGVLLLGLLLPAAAIVAQLVGGQF